MNNTKFILSMVTKTAIILLEIGFFGHCTVSVLRPDNLFGFGEVSAMRLQWCCISSSILPWAIYSGLLRLRIFSIAETLFSQVLAFGIADLLLYGEFCMIRHNYVNLVPGLITVGSQFLVAGLWAFLSKRMTMAFSKPEKTLIVSGTRDTKAFLKKLQKLKYILRVEKVIPYEQLGKDWKKQLDPYEAVIFYEVRGARRSEMLWYCMQDRKAMYVTPRLEEITMQGFGAGI